MIISNTLVTNFVGRDGGLRAMFGSIESGIMGIGRASQTGQAQTSAWERQMRAFGTTIRYAFAGTAIFGITSMIGKLNQLQQQMGLISAIAGPSGVNLTGSGLAALEDELSAKAVAARTNLSELNDATINFLSTVQGAKPAELPDIVGQIGITAKLSQTPTEDLTKAITTMNIAAGRTNNLKNINALLREWFHLISQAPGGISAAPQIAQQLGPLAAVGRLGRLTPEQLFGVSLGALRFGATPSTALRGGQYFLQSLFQPGKAQAKNLVAAGFSPQRLASEGGVKFMIDYLEHLRQLGTVPTRAQATQFGGIADLATATDTEAGLAPNQNIPGMTPAQQAFLRGTIGRIHGIRTAVVLLSQLFQQGKVTSLTDVLKSFQQIQEGVGPDAKELLRASEQYRRETPLQAAAVALDTLRMSVARDIGPALSFAVNPITSGAQHLIGNRGTRHIAEFGAAAFLAALVGRRFIPGMGGRLARIPGLGRILGGGGQAIVTAQAVAAEMGQGGHRTGQTPHDSLYVTVVGQIFGGGGGGGGTPIPTPLPNIPKTPPGDLPWWLAGGLRGGALRFGGPFLAALAATQETFKLAGHDPQYSLRNVPGNFMRMVHTGGRALHFLGFGGGGQPRPVADPRFRWLNFFAQHTERMTPIQSQILQEFKKQDLSAREANKLLRPFEWGGLRRVARVAEGDRITNVRGLKFDAQGELVLDLVIQHGDQVQRQRVHLPASVYEGGKMPVSRGRRKTQRVTFSPTGGARKGQ